MPDLFLGGLFLLSKVNAYLTGDNQVVIPGADSYNGLNVVPQMGWDNWNAYGCDVSEDLLLSTAQAMIDYGLRDLGYNYIVLDDCWSIGRNSSGYQVANPIKFPHGMRNVADRLHSLGFKFGMYSSAGAYTCGNYPGSLGYETQDAQFFADNNVDYLKYDNCYNQGQSGTAEISFNRYNTMSQALNATGRSIVYSLCNWGEDQTYNWATGISNSGRMSGDIYDFFNRPDSRCPCTESPCEYPGYRCSVMNIIGKMAAIQSKTQKGWFNDMDMLEIGNGGQDDNEYVTHFSMWSLLSSPLLIGTNVRDLSPEGLTIYSNPAVIALNQDPTGTAAYRVWLKQCDDKDKYGQCNYQLWVREMQNGDFVLALINNGNSNANLTADLYDIFLDQSTSGASKPAAQLSEKWEVYDLWGNRMSNRTAAAIINRANGDSGSNVTDFSFAYNSSDISYAKGIETNNSALFGSKVGIIPPHGSWSAEIPRHSTGLYRIRQI